MFRLSKGVSVLRPFRASRRFLSTNLEEVQNRRLLSPELENALVNAINEHKKPSTADYVSDTVIACVIGCVFINTFFTCWTNERYVLDLQKKLYTLEKKQMIADETDITKKLAYIMSLQAK